MFTVTGASFANSSSLMSPMPILIVAKYFLLISIVSAGAQAYFFVTFPPTTGVEIGVAAHAAVVLRLVAAVDPEPTVGVLVLPSPPHAASTSAPATIASTTRFIIDPATSAAR